MPSRAGLLLGIFAYYVFLALTRRIDADEGFFLYAARLIHEGRVPYRDFFDPHLPTTPYVWSMLWLLPGAGWTAARLLTAIIATATAWIFAHLVWRATQHRGVFFALLLAYLLSDYGLEWAPVVKTYSLSMFFMMLGWAAGTQSGRNNRWRFGAWALSGLCAGLMFGTRLMTIPAAGLIFIFAALVAWQSGESISTFLACWVGGFVGALFLLMIIFLQDSFAMTYANWSYHFLGEAPTPREHWHGALRVAFDRVFRQPVWIGALLLLARDAWRKYWRDSTQWCYRLCFASMAFVAFTPPHSFHQYYCLATPWLLLAIAPGLEEWWRKAGNPWRRRHLIARWAVGALAVLALLYEPYHALERRWPTWTWHPMTPEAGEEFDNRLSTIRAISRRVDALAPPGSGFLAWWPGYGLEARTPLLPGFEDQFGLRVGYYVNKPDLLKRLHVHNEADVEALIQAHVPSVIVSGLWAGAESQLTPEQCEQKILDGGYVLRERIGKAGIFTLPSAATK